MKKTLCVIMAAAMLLSICACGAGPAQPEAASKPSAAEDSPVVNEVWDELEKLGKVEKDAGGAYTLVTMPAEFSEGATQEILDSSAGVTYTSAKLNDDGSVTYRLTKKQHGDMLLGMKQMVDEGLQALIGSDEYAFTKIEHNSDYTEYDVSISTEEIGMNESFMTIVFYMYSGLYNVFTGHSTDNVAVHFHDPSGKLIDPAGE